MSNFGSFSYFQTFRLFGVQQGLPKFDINDLRLLFHCNILIPRKCPRKTPFKTQCWGVTSSSDGPTLLLCGLYIATALLRSRSCLGFVMEDRARLSIEAVLVRETKSTYSYGGGGNVKVFR